MIILSILITGADLLGGGGRRGDRPLPWAFFLKKLIGS